MSNSPLKALGRLKKPIAYLAVLTSLLLTLTACLEDFGELVTSVRQEGEMFYIERTLVNVQRDFFNCSEVEICVDAVKRAIDLNPAEIIDAANSDKLVRRLLETGAQNIVFTLKRFDNRLDIGVRYQAPLGSKAADDTQVFLEWGGKEGKEQYYLIVTALENMSPPTIPYSSRIRTYAGGGGKALETTWILEPETREVTTSLKVEPEGRPLFEEMPELGAALKKYLESEVSTEVATNSSETPSEPAPSAEPTSPPIPPLEGERLGANTKLYWHAPRISGPIPLDFLAIAIEPLKNAFHACYDQRVALPGGSAVGGTLFIDAIIRKDGFIQTISLYGGVYDPPLLKCLQPIVDGFTFSNFQMEESAQISLPVTFQWVPPPPVLPEKGKKK